MDTEIELKYLVNDTDVVEKVTTLLHQKQLTFKQSEKSLTNCYFDTAGLELRKLDMGLRVRTCDQEHIEQTIKTAGQVVGGLHQRPEYNVDIDNPFPLLTLFPEKIWSDRQQASRLQEQLVSLFTTDFNRSVWLIDGIGNSRIELVFDQGTISSNGREAPICEIEIELVEGKTEDLFTLAELLFNHIAVRPGTLSKAARGYALYNDVDLQVELTPLELVPLSEEADIGQAFFAGLEFGLKQLQLVVNSYINAPSLQYLDKVTEILALLRQGFWLFDDYLPAHTKFIRDELSHFIQQLKWVDNAIYIKELTNKTGNYRKKLELSEQLFSQLKIEKRRIPDIANVTALFHSARFNEFQLLIVKFLLSPSFSQEFDSKSDSLTKFSRKCLDTSLADLKAEIGGEQPLSSERYIENRKILNRCLLTGSWFGDLYSKIERLEFRNPWLDIKQGMSELQTLWLLHQQLERLEDQPQKLVNWQASKVESLLSVLEFSRQNALSLPPYWHSY